MTTLVSPLPTAAINIKKVDVFVFRAPVQIPVKTSFGAMHDRPAVFVKLEDHDGVVGWGEVWSNFPACGAEHRARLVDTVLAPLLLAQTFDGPVDTFQRLTDETAILAIQCGEQGPFAQAISGVDIALWDMCARRAGQPLWRYLAGDSDRIQVYTSGISPDCPMEIVTQKLNEGYRKFKLKIGFDKQQDLHNVKMLRDELGPAVSLMVDANQGWNLETALHMCPLLEPFDIAWLEEPLRADCPWDTWHELARATHIPLAAGENIASDLAFAAAISSGALSVVQPDVAKWGGISGNWPVIAMIQQAGRRYCPHYLGAGIGLLASAHLLAATGGDGALEIDANINPLRTSLSPALCNISEGYAELGHEAGLGITPDLQELSASSRRTY